MTPGFAQTGLIALSGVTFVFNLYAILWALEGWDIVSFDGLREQFSFLGEWQDTFFAIKMIAEPLDEIKEGLAVWRADDRFNPYENYGFYYMVLAFIYPLVWSLMTLLAIPIILSMPILMSLYWLDRDLFIDNEESKGVKNYLVPHKGIPTAFA